MRVKLLRFYSYPGGVTDFNALRTLPQNPAASTSRSTSCFPQAPEMDAPMRWSLQCETLGSAKTN